MPVARVQEEHGKSEGHDSSESHGPPATLFGQIYRHYVKQSPIYESMGFKHADEIKSNLGQFQFEGLAQSLLLAALIACVAMLGSRRYQRVPSGMQNFLEMCVDGLRKMYRMLIGPLADKHLAYLGSLFIFIFCMNLIGIVPFFRSPTMVLSITLAMGICTFLYVQTQALRVNGPVGYIKHMMGPVIFLAPLMFVLELLGEFIKPATLAMRLYGNISGEDTLIEKFLEMGEKIYVPIHAPFVAFAIFTSFLQAFIFTALTSIYLQLVASHGDEEASEEHH